MNQFSLLIFIAGLLCGVFLPHALIYAKVCDHFIKCMRKRDKQIHDLMVENQALRKMIKSPDMGITPEQLGEIGRHPEKMDEILKGIEDKES